MAIYFFPFSAISIETGTKDLMHKTKNFVWFVRIQQKSKLRTIYTFSSFKLDMVSKNGQKTV